jgi:tetratricopeptide (TPR) repeat protein
MRPCLFCSLLLLATLCCPAHAHDRSPSNKARLDSQIVDDADDATALLERGLLFASYEQWDHALADLTRARDLSPELDTIDLAEGRVLWSASRPAEALVALDRYATHNPNHAFVQLLRARCLAAVGDPEALATYRRAIDLAETPGPTLFLEAAAIAVERDELPVALEIITSGLSLSDAATLQARALDLELKLGRHAAALSRLDDLVASAPRPETWLVSRGDVLWDLGRWAEARRDYTAALDAIAGLPPTARSRERVLNLRTHSEARISLPEPE